MKRARFAGHPTLLDLEEVNEGGGGVEVKLFHVVFVVR